MSSKKPLAPTSRPKSKAESATTTVVKAPAAAATVSKTSLHPVFVYGSLKKDFQLHEHYLLDQMMVGKAVIEGYTLISLGQYPALMQTGNPKHKVEGEYYLVSDEAFESMKSMEERAGYTTETVRGHFATNDRQPTMSDATFSAKAWVFFKCSDGTARWDTFHERGKDWLYVRTTPDTQPQENKTS